MKNKALVIVPMAPIFVNVPNNLLHYVYDAKFVILYQISTIPILYISHKYLKCDIVYIIMQFHNIIISLGHDIKEVRLYTYTTFTKKHLDRTSRWVVTKESKP